MIISTVELRKLEAGSGMILTNGEAYGKEIYLGKNDAPENWYEITDEEHERIMKEQEESIEAKQKEGEINDI